jgi:hypothetical protein
MTRATIRVAILALMCTLWVQAATPAQAGDETCDGSAELWEVERTCLSGPSEVQAAFASGGSDGYRYRYRLHCADRIAEDDVQCVGAAVPCTSVPDGTLYDLFRAEAAPGSVWELIGVTCLGAGDLTRLGEITPELVLTAFKKLQWPKPELVVQPPGGETLVNFETNFYTTLTTPQTQTVTLLGQQVTIEATPARYRFNFDENGEHTDTDNPGAPYPQLDNTYEYREAHLTRHPWVDVAYTGRYRIAGSRGWTTIPNSLTVAGDPVNLTVIEGQPNLIGTP